mgnify:CR=1 FL=1
MDLTLQSVADSDPEFLALGFHLNIAASITC